MKIEITRRAELAVLALALLSRTGERLKAPMLASALDTTAAFVPQVLGPLVRAGWVHSDPGPHGGYVSLVELDAVSLLDVIEAVDGTTASRGCVVADRECQVERPCAMHTAWALARSELFKVLASTPMSSVDAVLV